MSIQLNHVSKSVKKNKSNFQILNDVSVELPDLGIVLLTGPNGCGKSTLLSLIGALDNPSNGQVIYQGKNLSSLSEKKKARLRSEDFGYVFADAELLPGETVEKNIALSLELQGKKADRNEIASLLPSLGIDQADSFLSKKARDLSTGEEARVSIARALIKKPKVLLFDEGLDGVDSQSRKKILALLTSLSDQMLILIVSHYPEEILPIASRHLSMDSGKILSDEVLKASLPKSKESEEEEKTKGGRLRFRNSFYFSRKLVSNRKVRFVLSLVASFLALVFFGLGMTGALSDPNRSQLEMMYDDGLTQAILVGKSALHIEGWPDSLGEALSDEQADILKDYQKGTELIRVNYEKSFYTSYTDDETGEVISQENIYFDQSVNYPLEEESLTNDNLYRIRGFLEVDPDSNLLDWEEDTRLSSSADCHLPSDETEMALPSHIADFYLENGYRNEEGTVERLSSLDDLIGKKLDRFTICGIYTPKEPEEIMTRHIADTSTQFDGLELRDYYLSGTFLNTFAIVYKHSFRDFH